MRQDRDVVSEIIVAVEEITNRAETLHRAKEHRDEPTATRGRIGHKAPTPHIKTHHQLSKGTTIGIIVSPTDTMSGTIIKVIAVKIRGGITTGRNPFKPNGWVEQKSEQNAATNAEYGTIPKQRPA